MAEPGAKRWVGIGLVGLAGVLMVVATFSPWVEQPRMSVEWHPRYPLTEDPRLTELRLSGLRQYSGWQLETYCPGRFECWIDDRPVPVVPTGPATLLGGLALLVAAGLLALATTTRRRAVHALCAVVASVAVLLVAATTAVVWATTSPNAHLYSREVNHPRFGSVLWGVAVAIAAAAIAIVGLAVTLWPRHGTRSDVTV